MRAACLASIFFLRSLLPAQENSSSLEGAVYEGKKVVLTGEVSLQHGLGQILAHRLSFIPAKGNPSNSNTLEISDNVRILLNGGGELQCQKADVDYAKMRGNFLGNAEFPDVVYRNEGIEKGSLEGDRAAVEFKSRQMILHLTKEPGIDPSSAQTLVNQIEAVQNVRVGYDKDNLLIADRAVYQRLPNGETAALAGLLTLSVRGDDSFCQLTNGYGDCLLAKTIQADTADRKLWFSKSKGKLLMREEREPLQTLEFKSDELTWNNQTHILVLKGDVDISQNANLHIKTNHEIAIAQSFSDGNRTLLSINSPEKTELLTIDALKGNTHRIYCPGSLTIDHKNQHITLQGIVDGSDLTEESGQVFIEDVLGEMYADLVSIDYCWEGNQFTPKKVILEGNVRLLNRFDGHVEEASSVLHYALADRIDYFPEKKEMLLCGSDNQRVLLLDKVNNIQMSAPSLKVQQDSLSRKDIIQGMGDVRFTFLEKELARFKQHFKQNNELREEVKDGK